MVLWSQRAHTDDSKIGLQVIIASPPSARNLSQACAPRAGSITSSRKLEHLRDLH